MIIANKSASEEDSMRLGGRDDAAFTSVSSDYTDVTISTQTTISDYSSQSDIPTKKTSQSIVLESDLLSKTTSIKLCTSVKQTTQPAPIRVPRAQNRSQDKMYGGAKKNKSVSGLSDGRGLPDKLGTESVRTLVVTNGEDRRAKGKSRIFSEYLVIF